VFPVRSGVENRETGDRKVEFSFVYIYVCVCVCVLSVHTCEMLKLNSELKY